MNRLPAELQRLYLLPDARPPGAPPASPRLTDDQGRTRALVLEVLPPAAWQPLGRLWEAAQAELHLSAPAIAVSGAGLQLWFSLAQPVPVQQAQAFLAALARRHLADLPRGRLRMWPSGAGETDGVAVPPAQVGAGRWSAFVAADLAALFTDEPWLDLPPGADAQAELLAHMQTTPLAQWQEALAGLQAEDVQGTGAPAAEEQPARTPSPPQPHADPRQFLLQVMNDGSVSLQLRIEAAKALLSHAQR